MQLRFRRALFTILLAGLLAAGCLPSGAKPPTTTEFWRPYQTNSPDDDFARFVLDSIENAYAYLSYKEELLGFRWPEVRQEYERRLQAAESGADRLVLLGEAVRLLDDGHTLVVPVAVDGLEATLPLEIRKEGSAFLVTAFTADVAAQLPWLEPGTRLLSIDGKPMEAIWNDLMARSGYRLATRAADRLLARNLFRAYYYYNHLQGGPKTARLRLQGPLDTMGELELTWQKASRFAENGSFQIRRQTVPKGIEGRLMGDVGYIRINTLSLPDDKQIDAAFAAVAGARALVLDIRHNSGGDFTGRGHRIVAHLVDEARPTGSKEFRYSPHLHLFGSDRPGYPGLPRNPKQEFSKVQKSQVKPVKTANVAGKPMLMLIDGTTFSSGDSLLHAFHDLKLGRLVGRADMGNSGQPVRIPFPSRPGLELHLSTVISRGPSGEVVEGRLLQPDIPVPLTRAEILGESDPILEAALKALTP